MEFIRENILKIISIIVVIFIVIIVCYIGFLGKNVSMPKDYNTMQERMIEASKKYVSKNNKLLPKLENEVSKVNLDTLINEKYIKKLVSIEDKEVSCSGYVQIKNIKNTYDYVPYLKCGKYYETKTLSDYIKDNTEIVTMNDGLYKNNNEYIYRGENPNNYIVLGTRLYRIMSINSDNEIKLLSTEKYSDTIIWDDRYNVEKKSNYGINEFSKSRLKENLDNIYKDETFFSAQEKKKMISHNICVGKRSLNDQNIYSESECSKEEANQYVSIMRVSDYSKASIDQNCNSVNNRSCSNYNYFESLNSYSFRTINAVSDNTYQIYYIEKGSLNATYASNSFYIYPIIYISDNSLYKTGNGTLENPYVVR